MQSDINKIIESVLSMEEIIRYKGYLYWPDQFKDEEIPAKVKLALDKVREYEKSNNK